MSCGDIVMGATAQLFVTASVNAEVAAVAGRSLGQGQVLLEGKLLCGEHILCTVMPEYGHSYGLFGVWSRRD